MKIKHMLWAALPAVLALTACQSNEPVAPGSDPDMDLTDGGYMAVQLTLPSVPGTRANDNFDDGLENEYKVDNAALLLFKGDTEADAVLQRNNSVLEGCENQRSRRSGRSPRNGCCQLQEHLKR